MRHRQTLPRTDRAGRASWRPLGRVAGVFAAAVLLGACSGLGAAEPSRRPAPTARRASGALRHISVGSGRARDGLSTSATPTTSTSTSQSTTTATTTAPTTTTATTATTATTPPPVVGAGAPGLVAGRVTILGDSVTIDAAPDLQADIKGAVVEANVGEQWYQGVAEVQSLRAEGALGAVVVVALGTNGPITSADIGQMMQALAGCARVVLVTNHVPDWWQNPNNQLLASAAARYPNVALADWEALAAQHPGWFYADGTHMPIGGPGAQAFAALVASRV